MGSTQVESRPLRHLVHHGLDQPLLLQNVAYVLKALQLGTHEPELLFLVLPLIVQCLLQYFESINCGVYILQIIVQQRFCFIDVEGADLQDLGFQAPHVREYRVIEYMYSKIILDEMKLTLLVQIDLVNPTEELLTFSLLDVRVSSHINFC